MSRDTYRRLDPAFRFEIEKLLMEGWGINKCAREYGLYYNHVKQIRDKIPNRKIKSNKVKK